MPEQSYSYMWRCAKCYYHFANIMKSEGLQKLEKKCPKCKALNKLTITDKEILIHCKFYDTETNDYGANYDGLYENGNY